MIGIEHANSEIVYWPVLAALALLLAGVALGYMARRHRNSVERSLEQRAPTPQPDELTVDWPAPEHMQGDETPTIRITNAKRIDRLHRAVTLRAGEKIDLLDLTFDRIPRLRIEFVGFEQDLARIHVELGGATAGCGSQVRELAPNQFLLPLAARDEQRASILHFYGQGDAVSFLRIKVTNMRFDSPSIDADVLHVCSNWSEQGSR